MNLKSERETERMLAFRRGVFVGVIIAQIGLAVVCAVWKLIL